MKQIKVSIRRGNQTNSYLDTFLVPLGERMSVMDVLKYIYENLDGTLAYFSHEACHQVACGRCLVKVNGKTKLACGTTAEGDLLLEPWNDRVIRDLVCAS